MKIKPQNTTKTQLVKANEALIAISENITADDRRDAPASEPTVISYLKGEGTKLKTALKLLKFFRKRIEKREKELVDQ